MSTRVFAVNMAFLGTPPFSGFQKDPWKPKSESTTTIFVENYYGMLIFLVTSETCMFILHG